MRVTGHDVPYPPAKLEKHHLPDLDRILDGVDRALGRVASDHGPGTVAACCGSSSFPISARG